MAQALDVPQNIVIGGLAGALPQVIGWAAATNSAPLNAWLLCAIIFMWTPPHFWALSLYTSEDYQKAGVPMMPVTAGAASTRKQILIYSLLFVPLCIVPAFTGLGGLDTLSGGLGARRVGLPGPGLAGVSAADPAMRAASATTTASMTSRPAPRMRATFSPSRSST